MSGVEDDSVKVGVEAYMLKKITKDIPLEPFLVALMWDHLFDLKLAGTNFRTPARIDLLLGAEVFTSILRDGQRTGPQGTPSALNTCFGWVLFRKIDGQSDVVNVANHTLEQLVYTEETETRRFYAAVLTASKNGDLRYLRRRKKHESDHVDCRTRQKRLGKFSTSQGAKDDSYNPEDAGEAIGKPKGFSQWDVDARMP